MDNTGNHRHIIDTLFLLSLLFAFVFCSVLIIALGASIYGRCVDRASNNFDVRTASAYIMQKVRQTDELDSISTGTMGSSDSLILRKTINGQSYTTSLYVYDNYLMEVMCTEGTTLSPMSGQRITALTHMQVIQKQSGLYMVLLTMPDGEKLPLYVATHCPSGT